MSKKKSDAPIVFVVGNSRSGTTMMAMILNNHPEVLKFLELHFFEELWTSSDKGKLISRSSAVEITSRLICAQRDQYVFQGDPSRFSQESNAIVNTIEADSLTADKLFKAFLTYEASNNGKTIPCENTPRNVFYITDILELFPEARIINMVRDPRDILLSQKNKWRRWYLGERSLPYKEVIRLFTNYHPITISKLWTSSLNAADKFDGNPRVISMRYEDIINKPDEIMKHVCAFIGIDFTPGMLEIPIGGSSTMKDTKDEKGISKSSIGNWRKGGLNSAEIYICQKITGDIMKKHGYVPEPVQPNPLRLIYYVFTFPIKIALSILLNLNRMRNFMESISRRLN